MCWILQEELVSLRNSPSAFLEEKAEKKVEKKEKKAAREFCFCAR
jgi:hypothetical protein